MNKNIYDDEEFSSEYDKMRKERKGYNANDLIEIPNFRKLVPSVKGKRILDLGCGYGESDRYYKEKGASYVLGIDNSEHMIQIALKENKIEGVEYKKLALENLSELKEKFDIVISSLVFHYIKDYKKLIKDIYNVLNENGVLIFSQEHPIKNGTILEPWTENKDIEINGKTFYLFSDYNRSGVRYKDWNGKKVKVYHRTFSEVINGLVDAGFKIDKLLEPIPNEEMVKRVPKYIHQYDRPFFLFVKASK